MLQDVSRVCDHFGSLGIKALKKVIKAVKDYSKPASRPKEAHYIKPDNDFTELNQEGICQTNNNKTLNLLDTEAIFTTYHEKQKHEEIIL